MKFTALPLKGAYLIEMSPHYDERGYFARTFCKNEFSRHGLVTQFVQMNTSLSSLKGQIRGIHYQEEPYAETKLLRCTKGSLLDVILDLRPESTTYQQSYGVVLSSENCKMLYIPKGFANGYKTLEDNTEISYMVDQEYVPEAQREISPTLFDQLQYKIMEV